jgi:hypothetical protein
MAWEWVAPAATGVAAVTGLFFTWLTAKQGRDQVERMARRAQETAVQDRLALERREAYFAALRTATLSLRRMRYERQGEAAKLAELDQLWPKGKRVEMEIDATIALETFGTPRARDLLQQWSDAADGKKEDTMRALRNAMIDLARDELGAQLPSNFGDPATA